jgi:hypothetical protein
LVALHSTLDPARRTEAHERADIYTTGLTTHPTGVARGLNGRDFAWQPEVLYYEYARADAAHELRLSKVPR